MVFHKPVRKLPLNFKPRVKWVKRANMWVKVSVKKDLMVHEWFSKDNKPSILD